MSCCLPGACHIHDQITESCMMLGCFAALHCVFFRRFVCVHISLHYVRTRTCVCVRMHMYTHGLQAAGGCVVLGGVETMGATSLRMGPGWRPACMPARPPACPPAHPPAYPPTVTNALGRLVFPHAALCFSSCIVSGRMRLHFGALTRLKS